MATGPRVSTEDVDPRKIEETRQQIRAHVMEIGRLSKSEIAPAEFFSQFLSNVVNALVAAGGAVWLREDDGRLNLQYQINLRDTRLGESEENQIRHGKVLQQILTSGEGAVVLPQSGFGDDGEAGNPTEFLLVLAPVKGDQRAEGLVEVFMPPGGRLNNQQGYLRFVTSMCDLASNYLNSRHLRKYSDRQALWNQLEQFTLATHACLDPRQTAYTIANEGRRLIECDSVAIAMRHGNKYRIEAISGQDTFDKRSTRVALMAELATAVARTGESIWYTGDMQDMAPQVEEAISNYVDECHSKTVGVLPLQRPLTPDQIEDPLVKRETVGAMIVEIIEDARPRDGMLQRVEAVAAHSSIALTNSQDHNSLFLMPLWKKLGKAKWFIQARQLPKTVAALVALVAVIVGLVVVPAEFKLRGDGTLEPKRKKELYARVGGDVDKVLVEHGKAVKEGDPLIQLRSTELDIQLQDLEGQRLAAIEDRRMNERLRLSPAASVTPVEKARLAGQIKQLEEKIKSLDKLIGLRKQEQEELVVTSPMNGIVVTPWEVLENLPRRPIERGQQLLTLADPSQDQDWELEVEMPEDRIGHILAAQKRAKDNNEPLKVTYVLQTQPGVVHEGTVKLIESRAEVRGEKGNTVVIHVDIDEQAHDCRPGAGITASVHCGKRSVGYVYLHDFFAWLQKMKFKWL